MQNAVRRCGSTYWGEGAIRLEGFVLTEKLLVWRLFSCGTSGVEGVCSRQSGSVL